MTLPPSDSQYEQFDEEFVHFGPNDITISTNWSITTTPDRPCTSTKKRSQEETLLKLPRASCFPITWKRLAFSKGKSQSLRRSRHPRTVPMVRLQPKWSTFLRHFVDLRKSQWPSKKPPYADGSPRKAPPLLSPEAATGGESGLCPQSYVKSRLEAVRGKDVLDIFLKKQRVK